MITTQERPLNDFLELATQPRWEALESQRYLLLDELSQLEESIGLPLQHAESECGVNFASGLPNTITDLKEDVLKRLFKIMNHYRVEVGRIKHVSDQTPGWSSTDTNPHLDPTTYTEELYALKTEAQYFAENQPKSLKLIDAAKYPIWPAEPKISAAPATYATDFQASDLFRIPAYYLNQGVNNG